MSEDFFIGDTHFGHRGILAYESKTRPFTTIEEHDAEIVRRWNAVVSPKDKVFHLGDFCFGKKNLDAAYTLNGDKVLIMGNHDTYESVAYLKYFRKIVGALQYDNCMLTHIPIHPDQFYRFYANIHGHLHSHTINDWRYANVSCEHTNLTPIPYCEVLSRIVEQKKKQEEQV